MTKTAKIYGDSLYDLAAEEKLTELNIPLDGAVSDRKSVV